MVKRLTLKKKKTGFCFKNLYYIRTFVPCHALSISVVVPGKNNNYYACRASHGYSP
ncbi:putative immunoglobulin/major histocompatibility complex [Helianthus annuus]|nr:putative immunoglobulin/major histocompatibility complex [Helianthus annuus]